MIFESWHLDLHSERPKAETGLSPTDAISIALAMAETAFRILPKPHFAFCIRLVVAATTNQMQNAASASAFPFCALVAQRDDLMQIALARSAPRHFALHPASARTGD